MLSQRFCILPAARPFVKNFFHVFSNLFVPAQVLPNSVVPATVSYLTTPSSLCQELFLTFFKIFCSQRLSMRFAGTAIAATVLYFTTAPELCQELFSTFSSFPDSLFDPRQPLIRNSDKRSVWGIKKDRTASAVLSCVGTTYLPGPSPDKYFRQKRA